MNIKTAFEQAKLRVKLCDREFALLQWHGERDDPNQKGQGPYLITVDGDKAIEVKWNGAFSDIYMASTEGYSPVECDKTELKLHIEHLVRQLVERL